MTSENNSGTTLGWFHPGFYLYYPHVIGSTEHRRRLEHAENTARRIIGSTLTAACFARNLERPSIEPVLHGDRDWRRVRIGQATPADGSLPAVRRAIGEVGLTEQAYEKVYGDSSEGNEDTGLLLSIMAESGFHSPRELLRAAPVLNMGTGDSAPPVRLAPGKCGFDLQQAYGLLPDIEIAIRQAVTSVAVTAGIQE